MDELESLRQLLTIETIRSLAGETYFRRGEAYACEDAVLELIEDGDTLIGIVLGTEKYRVKLRAIESEVHWQCSCPLGEAGEFCKHVVAVALTWTDEMESRILLKRRNESPHQRIREYLETLPAERLAKILFEISLTDDDLADRLLMEAEVETIQQHQGLNGLQDMITRVIRIDDFLDYRSVRSYVAKVENLVDMMDRLCASGSASEVVPLTELAISELDEELVGSIDDSDGELDYSFERLMDLHLRACETSKPDPKILANSLFKLGCSANYHGFDQALVDYAHLLGKTGLKVYRELLEDAQRKFDEDETSDDLSGFNLADMEKGLLRAEGDWDGLISRYTENLDSAHSYLEAVRVCREAERPDRAIELLREGIDRLPNDRSIGLCSNLIKLLLSMEDHEEATKVAWETYERYPSGQTYFILKDTSEPAGEWNSWREKALKVYHSLLRKRAKKPDRSRFNPINASLLIKIHLDEGEFEDAWKAYEKFGGSSVSEFDLAEKAGELRSEKSINILKKSTLDVLTNTGRPVYAEGISILRHLRELMRSANKSKEFREFIDELRQKYKNRPAFLEMMTDEGL